MSNTKRWFDEPQARFRMGLDRGYKCKYCDDESHRSVVPVWKSFNPFWYRKENKCVRTEQIRNVRHQNKNLLKKGRYPDEKIYHTSSREHD